MGDGGLKRSSDVHGSAPEAVVDDREDRDGRREDRSIET